MLVLVWTWMSCIVQAYSTDITMITSISHDFHFGRPKFFQTSFLLLHNIPFIRCPPVVALISGPAIWRDVRRLESGRFRPENLPKTESWHGAPGPSALPLSGSIVFRIIQHTSPSDQTLITSLMLSNSTPILLVIGFHMHTSHSDYLPWTKPCLLFLV